MAKGEVTPICLVDIPTMMKRDIKSVQVRQASSVAMLIMTARDIRLVTRILVYLAAIIIMTIMGEKLAVAILACLEATITMMRKETGQVPVIRAHSGRIIIAMHRDAMLQPVCVDPMTVRRYGLCVVSGTTFWPEVALDELSYTPIMK